MKQTQTSRRRRSVLIVWHVSFLLLLLQRQVFVSLGFVTRGQRGSNRNNPTLLLHVVKATKTPPIVIRDWRRGEGKAIYNFLQSAEANSQGSFNPEGGLDLDCATEALLEESYNPEDGGCFLVALATTTTTEDDYPEPMLVGTAGLIVGTPIAYQASGSSVSSPELTAALRRCVAYSSPNTSLDSNIILQQLVQVIEKRAVQAKATQLIGLAYPNKTNTASTSSSYVQKPSLSFLEARGYTALAQQLTGVEAVQVGKSLTTTTRSDDNSPTTTTIRTSPATRIQESSISRVLQSGIAATLVGAALLGAIALVGQFLGMDTSLAPPPNGGDAVMNRGLGQPLSTQDLGQLLKEEQLKRSTLDGTQGRNAPREWNDLSIEEKREELALLQVVQGQNIRVK